VLSERFDAFMFAGTVVIVVGVALVTTAKVHSGPPQEPLSGLPEFESEV
jgi:drug/metabolite transporter (DMT)-like permease